MGKILECGHWHSLESTRMTRHLAIALVSSLMISCGQPKAPVSSREKTIISGAEREAALRSLPVGPWGFNEQTKKIDGAKEYTISRSANGWTGQTIFVRCQAAKPEVFIATDDILAPEHQGGNVARVRFDDGPVTKVSWGHSTSDKALFSRAPKPFIKQMAAHHTLMIEYQPFQERAKTTEFDLSGFPEQLAKLPKSCQ